jgi:hypothetical protein
MMLDMVNRVMIVMETMPGLVDWKGVNLQPNFNLLETLSYPSCGKIKDGHF